jgi:hypothetical protein
LVDTLHSQYSWKGKGNLIVFHFICSFIHIFLSFVL